MKSLFRWRNLASLLVLAAAVLAAQPVQAQVTTARLEGLVKDASGAVVPGVTVTATQAGTNVATDALSNDLGLYVFAKLPPGDYTITAQLPGFKRVEHKNIKLEVGDTASLPITLQVGDVGETVSVTEELSGVDTVSTSLGNVINTRQIEELPLVNRNPMDLFYLQPGANRFITGGRIDGLRGTTSNVTVEGIAATEPDLGSGATSVATAVPVEAVSQYRVVTSSASAEYGRGAGAQVQVVYRSGTNDFHGSLFEFHRNKALNANSFSNNRAGLPRPAFIRNQFGGSIGGPIVKDKAFFYFTYEGIRQKTESSNNYMVYTPTLKSGIFRYYTKAANSISLVDRNTGALLVSPADIAQIDLLNVDSTRIGKDPSGLFDKLVGQYSPNNYDIGDGLNTAGLRLNSINPAPENQIVFKGDYIINSNHRLAVSYGYRKTTSFGTLMPNGQRRTYNGWQKFPTAVISLNSTLTPTFLNEFRIGGTQRNSYSVNPDPDRFKPQGIVNFTGLGAPDRNHPANTGLMDVFTPVIYTLNDNVTWIKGAHSLRGGLDIRLSRDQLHYGDDYWNPVISTTNSNNPANVPALPDLAAADRTRAQQLVNDLTGTIGVIRQNYNANAADHYTPFEVKYLQLRAHEYGFFFQDTWKFRPNLTLNLGTRYELMPPHFEAGGLFANPIGGIDGVYGISGPLGETKLGIAPDKGRKMYKTDWNNFAPSVGFNWDPSNNGKWSIGANYRLTYDRHYLTNTLFQIVGQEGTSSDRTFNGTPGMRLTQLSSLFNAATGYFNPGVPFGPKDFNRNGLVTTYDPTYYTPYTANWSLRIQREVTKSMVLAVSYVGNKATGLMRSVDINQLELRKNGFLQGFLAAQRNYLANGSNPLAGEPTGVFGQLYSVMAPADQTSVRTDLGNGAVATTADFIDRTRASSKYLVAAGLPDNFFRANPQFQTAWIQGNNSNSTYNAMKVEVSRRFEQGLQFEGNYTFSKNLTDFEGSQSNRQAYRDNENRGLDKSFSGIDATHVWNANFVWELPVGQSKRWLSDTNTIIDGILGRWQMNGIFSYSSGTPFSITSGRNTFTTSASTADCVGCDPNMTSKVIKGAQIYALTQEEINMFKYPVAGSPGGTAQRLFRSPSRWVLDGSMFKSFPMHGLFGEQGELQTRFEFFNALNHTNFDGLSTANATLTSGTFGVLTPPTTGQRIIQVALKILF